MAYHCANNPSDLNEKCLVQRVAWDAKKLHEVNAVRVSVALPHFDPEAVRGLSCPANDLVVCVDRTNINLLLGKLASENLYQLLASATGTRREEWPKV